jgi:2-amino-4-hydroxy-6-hydroxymethyldihydropteridine diphosphokinase
MSAASRHSKAIANICGMTQAALLARSSDYATPPWGDEQQARFINACIEIETSLDPHALLFTLHKIEQKFGRDRALEKRWGPRTLDLDLIAYDDLSIQKRNALPHGCSAGFRAGAARGDCARPSHCGTQRCGGAGTAIHRGDRAVAGPCLTEIRCVNPKNNRLAWRPPRGNFRSNNRTAPGSDQPDDICN